MGKAYQVKCTECNYEEKFFLGPGSNDANMTKEAKKDLRSGLYGEQAREFSILASYGKIQCQRTLYRCRQCGNLEPRIKMRIVTQTLHFSQPYFCSKCGKLMGQVRPSDIKKQHCPICGKPIQVVNISNWDIAPYPLK